MLLQFGKPQCEKCIQSNFLYSASITLWWDVMSVTSSRIKMSSVRQVVIMSHVIMACKVTTVAMHNMSCMSVSPFHIQNLSRARQKVTILSTLAILHYTTLHFTLHYITLHYTTKETTFKKLTNSLFEIN